MTISSCFSFPVPSFDLKSAHGVVPEEVLQKIKLNETSRADLVLLIGGPDITYEGERYFVYQWEATEGVVVVPFGAGELPKRHYFCVEFDKGNKIKRFKHIQPGYIDSLYKQGSDAQAEFNAWINIE